MKIILIILCGWLFSGCASVVSSLSDGHPNRKEIPITPGATVITLADGKVIDGDNDGMVTIPRGAGPFRANVGRVEKDGYMIAVVQRRFNGWLLGNIVYGGPPGWVVDFVGGGAYNPTVVYLKEPTSTK